MVIDSVDSLTKQEYLVYKRLRSMISKHKLVINDD